MPTAEERELLTQLYEAYKHRAILYYLIFDVVREEEGHDKAVAMMKRAIYKRGVELGLQKYARFAPDDLLGLQRAFLDAVPDDGKMFQPEVERADTEALDIKFRRCPLKEAWIEAGLSDADVATLCEIAAEIDVGTFQGAGFCFCADTWKPDGDGCCRLHVRPGKPEQADPQ